MSLEIRVSNVDLTQDHTGESILPDAPVLTSSNLVGLTDQVMRADIFHGPVTFMPETEQNYTLFVPLHDGPREGRSYRDGRWVDIQSAPPVVHLSPQGERVGWTWSEGTKVLRLSAGRADMVRFVTGELRFAGMDSRLEGLHGMEDPEVCRIAGLLEQALADTRPGQTVIYDALTRMLVVHMVRTYLVAPKTDGHGSGMSAGQFAEIIDYIDSHIASTVRVVDLADLAHMSESAFLRSIKSLTGETPQDLIRSRRLEIARRHLRGGELSLGQIAIAAGFADQAHLSRSFKQAFGQSPSHWRRDHSKAV